MGLFIGRLGAAFIIAAAVAVIVKFLLEINVIKDKDSVIRYGKISLAVIIIGAIYVSAAAVMYNELKGQTNIFDYDKIFAFLGIDKTLALCEKPEAAGLFAGLRMPLYPLVINFFGSLIFQQFYSLAELVSFASACVSACMVYSMLTKRIGTKNAETFMLILASLPAALLLFVPSYFSLMTAFITASAYALDKGSKRAFIVLAILACLTGKLGILAFLIYPLRHELTNAVKSSEKFLSNGVYARILITSLLLASGAVLCCFIRGI